MTAAFAACGSGGGSSSSVTSGPPATVSPTGSTVSGTSTTTSVSSSRGVTVNVIAASQTDDPAEHAFREIAMGTGGRFVFLAYGAAGAAVGANSDISSTDYEALSLDDLIVRLVGEELATLTGDVFEAPTTTTVPVTNPPGQ